MGKLGCELWGFIGFVVDVILRKVERYSGESGDGINLREISRDQLVSKIQEKRIVTLATALVALER